jgi:hypothetical protein
LKKRYKTHKYDTIEYEYIRGILAPIIKEYEDKRTADADWIAMYKQAKQLEYKHNPELDINSDDAYFYIDVVLKVLLSIKHESHLFDPQIRSSEWDFIVKFWVFVTEKLFRYCGLGLK